MASPEGFEPSTARLEGVCSIQLSYEDIVLKEYIRQHPLLQALLQNFYITRHFFQNIPDSTAQEAWN